jgi:hypothetical protein
MDTLQALGLQLILNIQKVFPLVEKYHNCAMGLSRLKVSRTPVVDSLLKGPHAKTDLEEDRGRLLENNDWNHQEGTKKTSKKSELFVDISLPGNTSKYIFVESLIEN